jgi:hypothetical protein
MVVVEYSLKVFSVFITPLRIINRTSNKPQGDIHSEERSMSNISKVINVSLNTDYLKKLGNPVEAVNSAQNIIDGVGLVIKACNKMKQNGNIQILSNKDLISILRNGKKVDSVSTSINPFLPQFRDIISEIIPFKINKSERWTSWQKSASNNSLFKRFLITQDDVPFQQTTTLNKKLEAVKRLNTIV